MIKRIPKFPIVPFLLNIILTSHPLSFETQRLVGHPYCPLPCGNRHGLHPLASHYHIFHCFSHPHDFFYVGDGAYHPYRPAVHHGLYDGDGKPAVQGREHDGHLLLPGDVGIRGGVPLSIDITDEVRPLAFLPLFPDGGVGQHHRYMVACRMGIPPLAVVTEVEKDADVGLLPQCRFPVYLTGDIHFPDHSPGYVTVVVAAQQRAGVFLRHVHVVVEEACQADHLHGLAGMLFLKSPDVFFQSHILILFD